MAATTSVALCCGNSNRAPGWYFAVHIALPHDADLAGAIGCSYGMRGRRGDSGEHGHSLVIELEETQAGRVRIAHVDIEDQACVHGQALEPAGVERIDLDTRISQIGSNRLLQGRKSWWRRHQGTSESAPAGQTVSAPLPRARPLPVAISRVRSSLRTAGAGEYAQTSIVAVVIRTGLFHRKGLRTHRTMRRVECRVLPYSRCQSAGQRRRFQNDRLIDHLADGFQQFTLNRGVGDFALHVQLP